MFLTEQFFFQLRLYYPEHLDLQTETTQIILYTQQLRVTALKPAKYFWRPHFFFFVFFFFGGKKKMIPLQYKLQVIQSM